MQGNNLQDRAWDQMRDVLDKEMPVKNNRRGFLWILLSIFLLFIVSTISFGRWWKNQDVDLLPINTEQKNLAIHKNEIESNISEIVPLQESNNKNSIDNAKVNTGVLYSQPIKPDVKLKSVISVQKTLSDTDQNIPLVSNENPLETDILDKNIDLSNSSNLKSNSEMGLKLDIESKEIVTIQTLDRRSVSRLNYLITEPNLNFSLDEMLVTRAGTNEMVLSGMINAPFYSRVQGFSLGIGIRKRFNPKLHMNASLSFSRNFYNSNLAIGRINFDASTVQEGAMDPLVDINFTNVEWTNNNGKLKSEYYSLFAEQIQHLYYINFPFDVEYSFSPRNSIGMGLQYSYLLNNPFNSENNVLSFNANVDLSSSSDVSFPFTNRHHFFIMGNYRYKLSKTFTLKACFNYSLNKILRTESNQGIQNNLNYLGIGIEYKLKM